MKIKLRFLAPLAALFLTGASLAQTAAPQPQAPKVAAREKCGVIYQVEGAEPQSMLLPSIRLSSLAESDSFSLPADAPKGVKAVQCGRDTIVPFRYDYKVIQAGLPLSIVSEGKVGVLEIAEGKLRFRMLSGQMSESEQNFVGAFLDAASAALLKAKK
jgi:hypothetical protein